MELPAWKMGSVNSDGEVFLDEYFTAAELREIADRLDDGRLKYEPPEPVADRGPRAHGLSIVDANAQSKKMFVPRGLFEPSPFFEQLKDKDSDER